MVAFLAVFFVSTLLLGALTFDFARLANLKAELENSADAGAHAGIAFLIQRGCSNPSAYTAIRNEAQTFAIKNTAMQGTVTIVTNQLGRWIPHPLGGGNFAPAPNCPSGPDAIHVVVSRQSTGLFMSLVGVSAPVVQGEAFAWRCPVSTPPPWDPQCPTGPKPVLVIER